MLQQLRKLLPYLAMLCVLGTGQSALADDTGFSWPIGCIQGMNCVGQHFRIGYPDVRGNGLSFACSKPGYVGHQGTDIVVSSVEQGIPAMAAADGVVKWTEDGLFDHCVDDTPEECAESRKSLLPIAGRGDASIGFNAGNYVMLEHVINGRRYLTLYAHMRAGSLRVAPGQHISRGQELGKVGSSGNARIPHLHFGVYREDGGYYRPIDPWPGPCNDTSEGLWAFNPPYRDATLAISTPAADQSQDIQPEQQRQETISALRIDQTGTHSTPRVR